MLRAGSVQLSAALNKEEMKNKSSYAQKTPEKCRIVIITQKGPICTFKIAKNRWHRWRNMRLPSLYISCFDQFSSVNQCQPTGQKHCLPWVAENCWINKTWNICLCIHLAGLPVMDTNTSHVCSVSAMSQLQTHFTDPCFTPKLSDPSVP